MIRGVVFDLDDTLYLESEYVRSGFVHVAKHLSKLDRTLCQEEPLDFLWSQFQKGVQSRAFDRLLDAFPRLTAPVTVSDLVRVYRTHPPGIQLLPGAARILSQLQEEGYLLGLLSDGPLHSQEAKVKALGLGRWMRSVVLTDGWGSTFWKPHPRGFLHISRLWRLPPEALVYVGDNTGKDFLCPNQLGWITIRLRIAGQLRRGSSSPSPNHLPHHEAGSFPELKRLLDVLSSSSRRTKAVTVPASEAWKAHEDIYI